MIESLPGGIDHALVDDSRPRQPGFEISRRGSLLQSRFTYTRDGCRRTPWKYKNVERKN